MAAKEFLTKDRIEEIKIEINDLERRMKGGDDNSRDGVGYMTHTANQIQAPEDIQREIFKRKKLISDGTPKPFATTAQANKAFEWAKKAEKWINQHAPKGNDVHILYPDKGRQEHDFDRSVQQMTDWLKRGDKIYGQYRYIMRRLDPNNPNAGKIRGI